MPKFQTVVEVLKHWGTTDKDRLAFIFHSASDARFVMTCGQLYTLGGQLAHLLHEDGIAKGQVVVNTLLNSPERAVCEAGILMCGAASASGFCHLADGSDLMNIMTTSKASTIVLDPDLIWGPWTVLQNHVKVTQGSHVTSDALPFLRRVYFVRRRRESTNETGTMQTATSQERETCNKRGHLSYTKEHKEHTTEQTNSDEQPAHSKDERLPSVQKNLSQNCSNKMKEPATGTSLTDKLDNVGLTESVHQNKDCESSNPFNPKDPGEPWPTGASGTKGVNDEAVFGQQSREPNTQARILEFDSGLDFLSSLDKVDGFFVANVRSEDIATIFTTSGTTGLSKLVTYTHRTVVGVSTIRTNEEDYERCDKFFSIAPFGWTAGYAFNFLCSGNCRVVLDFRADMPTKAKYGCNVNITKAEYGCNINNQTTDFASETDVKSKCAPEGRTDHHQPQARSIDTKPEINEGTDVHELVRALPPQVSEHQRLTESDHATLVWDTIVEEECRLASFLPSLALQILRLKDRTPWSLNVLFLMGQPIHQHVVAQCREITRIVCVAYGCTELSLITGLTVTNFESFKDFHAGKPFSSCQVKVCDQSGQEVPTGTRGEIYAKTEHMLSGYYGQPDLTAAAMTQDGFFKTQDIGVLLEDGSLIVKGRSQDAIFKQHIIFYPGWLEARIQRCPGVHEVVIVGLPDQDGLEAYLCACFVPFDPDVTEQDVRKFVEKDIVTSEDDFTSPRPHYYLRFRSFPTTFSGKPRTKDIREEAIRRVCDGAKQ